MIDLILIVFFAAVFYLGFYLGAKYTTVKSMLDALVQYLLDIRKG